MSAFTWVNSSIRDPVPRNAVEGGKDSDGSPIYVGLAHFQGHEVPCKVVPRRRECLVGWNGTEHHVTNYKVLTTQKLHWVKTHGNSIPPDAIHAGRTSNGEILYVGRAPHNGALIVGKVHPSHQVIYIPYGGKEISYRDYEILVLR